MKKIIILILAVFISTIAVGDNSVSLNNLVFQNLKMPKTSVKKALKLTLRTSVNLEGKITQHVNDEYFEFTDNTASIIIKINHNIYPIGQVPLNQVAIVSGEIFKEGRKKILYVDKIDTVNNVKINNDFNDFNDYSANNSDLDLINIKQVRKYFNGSLIILIGKIVKNIGNKQYIFKDDTGKITIKIDGNILASGTQVPLNTDLKIIGEVNKSFLKPINIIVKKIEFMK